MSSIGKADNDDFVVLPLSTITHQNKKDINFDIEVSSTNYPLLNLSKISYIRTHKQLIIHKTNFYYEICNLKTIYPDLFIEILLKIETISKKNNT